MKLYLLFFILLLCFQRSSSQYILNGSAQKISCNCYTLTTETVFQSGSAWSINKISLKNSFDFWFNVFLGCKDADGADGIVFILQPISTSVGTNGEGMGFGGVAPSIGIALDTWQNSSQNDPAYDHISIQANGNTNHANDLAGPVPISPASDNVEDCQWHKLRITWDANTKWLRAYFDGALRVEKQIDLAATIFNNDPNVYWGFTGATGGAVNLQQFCTALNPIFTTNLASNNGCAGNTVAFTDASESFAPITNYNWSFGDGTSSTQVNPSHIYTNPGHYPVNLKIKGQDGCEKDSSITVNIGSIPSAAFKVFDTCFHSSPRIIPDTQGVGINYQWYVNNNLTSTNARPTFNALNPGNYNLKLVVASSYNCGPPDSVTKNFIIKPLPQVNAQVQDGCINELLSFTGTQTDNATTITNWQWDLGDGTHATTQNTQHSYRSFNQYAVKLSALASNGCSSDTVLVMVTINAAQVFAGNDTTVIKNLPFQLNGSGNGLFLWSPASGLSNPTIANPTTTLNNDQQFVLTVTTAEGCVASDTVFIKAFNGPTVYVPSAFTPNGDGKNDVLHPVYVGIKELKQFAVFNRWGQMLFTTNDQSKGWDGRDALPETYVWMVSAVNYLNQSFVLKGTVTLIR